MSNPAFEPDPRPRPHGRRRLFWAPFCVLGVLCLATTVVWELNRRDAFRAERTQSRLLVNELAARLGEFIDDRIRLLDLIHPARTEESSISGQWLRGYAEELRRRFDGFHAINWIDAEGTIRWVSPLEANRAALGRNVFDHPVAADVIRSARETRSVQMTGPLELFQGGRGFTAYVPEYADDGSLTGFINGVFLVEPLITSCLGDVFSAYGVVVRDGDTTVFRSSSDDRDAVGEFAATSELQLPGRTWTVTATPRRNALGTITRNSDAWILWGGLSLATAVAFVVWLGLTSADAERRAIESRAMLENRLERAQRLEALGKLAGGVAHDFNNILTAILGNADIVARRVQDEPTARQAIEQVVAGCDLASALTKRLLTFAKRRPLRVERVHFDDEIRQLRPMLAQFVRDGVDLRFELRAAHDVVAIDPSQISQIVLNLVLNAVDAMPDGGELLVQTRSIGSPTDRSVGAELVLSVSDTGIGMSESTRSRAFEPFYTTKELGKGTGLGLSTVYGEVHSVGGSLEIHSEEGHGTTVEVRLPLSAEHATHLGSRRERTPSGSPETNDGRVVHEDDTTVEDSRDQVAEISEPSTR
ncbi:MAG: CHASE domain-containing protein [Planctomycetes bacterium]|nr:CHASE domain-containing protein [Planctomycetota bacterium]